MTTITATNGLGTATPTSQMINSDFETFIKMLTTQAENQDPLNPMDSTEYATQLATFSAVEQQVQTNNLLTALLGASQQGQLADMASWVGMEGRLDGGIAYEGAPVTLHVTPPAGADRTDLVIYSETGEELSRLAIDPSGTQVQWDGRDATGAALPNGLYLTQLESYRADEILQVAPVQSWAAITETRLDATGAVELRLRDGSQVPASAITGLRDAT